MTPRIPPNAVNSLPNTAPQSVTQDAGVRIPLTKFVEGATRDILGRPSSPQETLGWVSQLSSGVSRQTLLTCLLHSPEKRAQIVQALHQKAFGRDASPGQVRFWCDRLQGGMTQEEVLAELLSSPEYTAVHGTRHEDWVQTLYREILGRRPATTEVDAWVGLLDSFTAQRKEVALDFLRADEYRAKAIRSWYWTLLHREPDAYLVESALERLRQGHSVEDIQIQILSGREYFNSKVLAR